MSGKHHHIDFYIIGIGNQLLPSLSGEMREAIDMSSVFSGGKRHYDLVKSLLPENHQWITLAGDIPSSVKEYEKAPKPVVVFASGDPLFYGFGNTLKRLLPDAKTHIFPTFNSIQRLCHKTGTNYNELKTVSVHGRDWSALDSALIKGESLLGVLTDKEKSPAKIAERMLNYGFDHYSMTVGEALDGKDERVEELNLKDCTKKTHHPLNCLLLKKVSEKNSPFGIPDHLFEPLPGRDNMITKMPVRLCTVHALDLHKARVLWDVGACTGSVSIEAKRHFPDLKVVAIEKREVSGGIIDRNAKKLSAPGIEIHVEDFFDVDPGKLPVPDAVFIGGHGGRLKEMIHRIHQVNPHVLFVTNAVQQSSSETFCQELEKLGYVLHTIRLKVNDHNKIHIHQAQILEK